MLPLLKISLSCSGDPVLCVWEVQFSERVSKNMATDTKLLKLRGVVLPLLKEYHCLAQVIQFCEFVVQTLPSLSLNI